MPVSLIENTHSYQGTLAILEPLKNELAQKLAHLSHLVVKINFVSTHRQLATTPFQSVKAFVDFIKPFFKGKIIIAEEATIGSTQSGFDQYGFSQLASQEKRVELLNSAQSKSKKITIRYPGGRLKLALARIYTQAPFLVSIARAKTHDSVVVTLAVKNVLVGAIQQKLLSRRSQIHQGKAIHPILAAIAKHVYPDLAIIDGVVGMEGNGPLDGHPIKAGWLVASLDALAADSLAAYLMGFKIEDIGYLNLLHQAGFGQLYSKDKIELIGPDPKKLVTPFKPHTTFPLQRQWHLSSS